MKSKVSVSREELLTKSFGNLNVVDQDLPDFVSPHTVRQKLLVKCTCGGTSYISPSDLFYGKRSSCGHCNDKPRDWWLAQKFGELTIIDKNLPEFLATKSQKPVLTECSCGQTKLIRIQSLTLGKSKSCRRCNAQPKEYFINQIFGKLTIIDQNLPEMVTPSQHLKVLTRCSCKDATEKYIQLSDITLGKATSCGCSQLFPGSVSEASRQIYAEILTFFPDAEFSVRTLLPGKEIDIYIPSKKLAFEYSGLIWHSSKFLTENRDFEKYKQLRELGIRYLNVYSDEWQKHKDIFLNVLIGVTTDENVKRIYNFDIVEVDQKEFQIYHDKWHYLSGRKVTASLYLLAKYQDQVIGGWSFRKSDENTLDWTRAFWDHNFKAWNPHEKALKYAIEKFSCEKVITFSDNRLFDGEMYSKLGFEKVSEIRPDYEYTNGFIRKHKFNLRVKAGIDEKLEAAKKGFFRIYDCGKVKWEFRKKALDK